MSGITLYHHWSSPDCMRLRLALGAKGLAYESRPLAYTDFGTPLDLGYDRVLPILEWPDGSRDNQSLTLLLELERRHPEPALLDGLVDAAEWQAFLDWHARLAPLLERLIAPVRPGFAEIGGDVEALALYKAECERHFGQIPEALSNDRYDGYRQLEQLGQLRALSSQLARKRFYAGQLSLIDILLTADFQLLRLLDGVTLPLDLMYYFQRVAEACHEDLDAGLQHAT
ncbi:glutathione S-transferase N-terminal domain-containing protein [Thermithiobacillus plumbiphilus]|uniref:Glutathione S-transferase N-terminal domain-containing protein n=1 Tax=Thermithiobacillus plumbiphilus TaxID=1729899 RepID=A0ABU9D726_9PROT